VRAPGYGGTPGALCCRSGSPPIPAGTSQRYSKRSPLTVLFRLQVQKYFLTRLWLILASPMASATQQFPGSKEERGGGISRHEASTSNHKSTPDAQQVPVANPTIECRE
jgi:hypothetical protein